MLSKLLASAVIVLAVAFAGSMYVHHHGCPLSGSCPMSEQSISSECGSCCEEKPSCCEEKATSECCEEKAAAAVAAPAAPAPK